MESETRCAHIRIFRTVLALDVRAVEARVRRRVEVGEHVLVSGAARAVGRVAVRSEAGRAGRGGGWRTDVALRDRAPNAVVGGGSAEDESVVVPGEALAPVRQIAEVSPAFSADGGGGRVAVLATLVRAGLTVVRQGLSGDEPVEVPLGGALTVVA